MNYDNAQVWSVWVGGSEVNSHYVTKAEAQRVAKWWKQQGYRDVVIRQEVW
jgi:hypothetical protein